MSSEVIICTLSLAAFFLLCWTMLLRLHIGELEKKVESLKKYLSVTAKLKDV